MSNLRKAIRISKKLHADRIGRDGEPHVSHLFRVMYVLMDLKMEEEYLIGAVLNGICDNTPLTNREVFQLFGKRVGYIVNALSGGELFMNRLWSAIQREPGILLIKMAFDLDILKQLSMFDDEERMSTLYRIENNLLPVYEKSSYLFESELGDAYGFLNEKIKILLARSRECLN